MEHGELTFYHGSLQYIDNGQFIVPGQDSGHGERMEDVYVTTVIGIAQQYAGYDGYVYIVKPSEDLEPDFTDDHGNTITYMCSKAKVLCCML